MKYVERCETEITTVNKYGEKQDATIHLIMEYGDRDGILYNQRQYNYAFRAISGRRVRSN